MGICEAERYFEIKDSNKFKDSQQDQGYFFNVEVATNVST